MHKSELNAERDLRKLLRPGRSALYFIFRKRHLVDIYTRTCHGMMRLNHHIADYQYYSRTPNSGHIYVLGSQGMYDAATEITRHLGKRLFGNSEALLPVVLD